jgi:methyltransferase (TIGR00027 family)
MHDARPSRTAERVAIRRAAHQFVDKPLVFDDPLAVLIIGERAASELRKKILTDEDRVSRALRAMVAVRSRYAEDQLATGVSRGVRQYVVLGAGLDTYAYRNRFRDQGLRVFEVDHPATQAWKRELLSAARIDLPSELSFVPVNFEQLNLGEELRKFGFRCEEPAFFSWLGVVMYLTHEAFASTIDFVGSLPAGSGIALDYAVEPSSLGLLERIVFEGVKRRVAAAGEPFRLFFAPQKIVAEFTQAGYQDLEDLGRDQINRRYFAGRADRLHVPANLYHLLSAWVAGAKAGPLGGGRAALKLP